MMREVERMMEYGWMVEGQASRRDIETFVEVF